MSFKTINQTCDYCLKSQNLEGKKEKRSPPKPHNFYYMYLLVCVCVCQFQEQNLGPDV